jgi:hypothetical protein
MKNTKTQAQKQADRDRRLAEQAAIRDQEREAHVAAIQRQLHESDEASGLKHILSKKEQRKLDRERTDRGQLSEISLAAAPAGSSNELSIESDRDKLPSSSYVNVHQGLQQEAKRRPDQEANDRDPNQQMYCSELRPVLTRLEKKLLNYQIQLGTINSCEDSVAELQVQFQVALSRTEFRFRAKNQSQMQDITIIVQDDIESPEIMVREAVEAALERPSLESSKDPMDDNEISASAYNRAASAEQSLIRRSEQEQRYHARIAREKAAQDERRIQERARVLATKVAAENVAAYAKRDDAIVRGVERSKHSMK